MMRAVSNRLAHIPSTFPALSDDTPFGHVQLGVSG